MNSLKSPIAENLEKEFYKLLENNKNILDIFQQDSFDGFWYWDLNNPQNNWLSDNLCKALGYDLKEKSYLKSHWQELIDTDDLKLIYAQLNKHLPDPEYNYSLVIRYRHKNLSTIWFKCKAVVIYDENNKAIRILCTYNDITKLKEVEQNINQGQTLSELVFNSSSDMLFIKDRHHKIIKANKAFLEIYPQDIRDKVVGTTSIDKFEPKDAEKFIKYDNLALEKGSSRELKHIKMPIGEYKTIDTHKVRFYDKNNNPFILCMSKDISKEKELIDEVKKNNKKLETIYYNDELTELLNRKGFIKEAKKILKKNSQNNSQIAILVVDLDNFKFINDSLGYSVGDLLINAVAKRLQTQLHNDNTLIAKSGSDDFLILIKDINNDTQIITIVENLISQISKPYRINNNKISQSISIGISMYPNTASDIDRLLQLAETAMLNAKAKGKNTYSFYSLGYDKASQRYAAIDRELRNANPKDFHIVYQPQFDTKNKIYGVEALMRWQPESLGKIDPDEFIPIAEKNQTIKSIGQRVFNKVLDDWNKLIELKLVDELKLAINVSSVQLLEDSFSKKIAAQFSKVKPNTVTLEITETHLLNNIDTTKTIISNIKKLGINFALDDFGTGYSSLKYLANLPIEYIKIDKSFVDDIEKQNNKIILTMIAQLAKTLNKYCIVEGVETLKQLDFLKSIGCDYFQGYYFSKPLAFLELKKLLQLQQ